MKIAIACEIAPAKTLIPIIKRMKDLEKLGKLKWNKSEIIALTHTEGVESLLKGYVDDIYPIGKSRRAGGKKTGKANLFYLIAKDIIKAIKGLKGKKIDLLISCGNAGDVRKSIIAAKLLRIPVIHIEQDIYNPIEVIAFANMITAPSKSYELFLRNSYELENVKNIEGYPMVTYIKDTVKDGNLKTKEEVKSLYLSDRFDEYVLIVLGGDLKKESMEELFNTINKIPHPVAIAPYRFDRDYLNKFIYNDNIIILDNYVDILSLIKHAKSTIYGAGMGMTLEVGVLDVPAIKIKGFHKNQGSNDLAKELNIPIIESENIPEKLLHLTKPRGNLIENSEKSIENIIDIINNYNDLGKGSGFGSLLSISRERKKAN
ncbi:hypothetical protein [Methanobrevibacter filiformis]|uniref:Undecaprenyldiphospho-muramoylpentapeptide beta-N-acetylglucosaminyltransferase n=1 Tax=Methanobrevibacter filiformis TaxID=55758 RepID=A0A166ESY3_9EURY|nr:hypothetical protein [Methanobrevibacter filiformis]KZX16976.1 hypothetical protein MBFIL_04260 [Methanobrevibacter filiformis]